MKVELKTLPKVSLDSLSHAGKVDGRLVGGPVGVGPQSDLKSVGGGSTKTETLVLFTIPYKPQFSGRLPKVPSSGVAQVYRHSHNAKTIYIDLV